MIIVIMPCASELWQHMRYQLTLGNSHIHVALFSLALLTLCVGCKKEDGSPIHIPLTLQVEHQVGDEALEFDTIRYLNASDTRFSVSRLLYFVSGITFISEDGERITDEGSYLVNAEEESTMLISMRPIPRGHYTGVELNIGIAPEQNIFGSLPNTVENNAMFWPEQMGGGYHFLKLEGHFIDSDLAYKGYALHLGTNEALVHVSMDQDIKVDLDNITVTLSMNVQEWFENPKNYDLNSGNYSMGDTALMKMISKNGSDVFTLEP